MMMIETLSRSDVWRCSQQYFSPLSPFAPFNLESCHHHDDENANILKLHSRLFCTLLFKGSLISTAASFPFPVLRASSDPEGLLRGKEVRKKCDLDPKLTLFTHFKEGRERERAKIASSD